MSTTPSEGHIYISSIAFSVAEKSHKIVDHIVIETRSGGFKKEVSHRLSHGQECKEVFDDLVELSANDELFTSLQYHSRLREGQPVEIIMKQGEIARGSQVDAHGNRTYTRFYRNINTLITIDFSRGSAPAGVPHVNRPGSANNKSPRASSQGLLLPTTSEILRICPRFRLLVIGNTGVGKSSLIRDVFGVKDASVSESSRGQADIEKEHVAAENGLFVLHDSLGLEAGEGANLAKVKKIIYDRRRKQDLKDRLHAVWVCLPVPYAKGRLLEAGMEEFLRDRKEILGNIPVVVVLTKLDLLDNYLMFAMRREGVVFRTTEEVKLSLEPRRTMFLEEFCVQPLRNVAGNDIPHLAVSTKKDYGLESTIPELVKKTTSEIERYIKADRSYDVVSEQSRMEQNAPLYVAGMAQRASIEEKVNLTIAIGKKKYWVNLGAGFISSAETAKEYLLVVHRDIVQVWNFEDPHNVLQDDEFKGALLDTSELELGDYAGVQGLLESMESMSQGLGPLIRHPAKVVAALPITKALVSLCYEIYKTSQTIPKRFMGYIVDLTYVIKILFVLAPYRSVTSDDVALALDVYTKSTYRRRVHLEISEFLSGAVIPARDAVVERIEMLIGRYKLTDEDVTRLRGEIAD